MKNTSIVFILSLLLATSCAKKQDWYCECGTPGTSTITYTTTISKATKNNATDLCNKAASQNLSNGTYACKVTAQ